MTCSNRKIIKPKQNTKFSKASQYFMSTPQRFSARFRQKVKLPVVKRNVLCTSSGYKLTNGWFSKN